MTPGIQELMRQVEKIWDGWCDDVLISHDLDAALAATAPEATLVNVPVLTGARGLDGLRRFLTEDLVPHLPVDLARRRLSRTTDRFRVVDEVAVSFTHDRELPWLLPGVAATHRRAEVLAITVVTVRQARIGAVRTLWDHVGLLAQLGLQLDAVRLGTAATVAVEGPSGWW